MTTALWRNEQPSIWLDDVRPMPDGFSHHAKSQDECISLLLGYDIRSISFDHDLGLDAAGSGYGVAKWIEERAAGGIRCVTNWRIHSANPVGARNIRMAMENADKMLEGFGV